MKKPKAPKKPKVKLSESELVKKYATDIIHRHMSRGMEGRVVKSENTPNKDVWQDSQFYFSVVFQSSEQKYEFLDAFAKKFNLKVEGDQQVEIVNGIKLANACGIPVKMVKSRDFPQADLDLRGFVLDDEHS